MQRIKDIQPKELVPGITGYYAHGDKHTLGLVELKAGSMVPEHHHLHEQITYILEGELDMIIGGESYSLTPGMYHVIPSNTPQRDCHHGLQTDRYVQPCSGRLQISRKIITAER